MGNRFSVGTGETCTKETRDACQLFSFEGTANPSYAPVIKCYAFCGACYIRLEDGRPNSRSWIHVNTLLIFSFVGAVKAFSSPAFAEIDCDLVFGGLFSLKIFVTFVQK